MLAQELLSNHAEPIVRKLLLMALQGDMKALQLCIDRIVPVLRELPIKLGALPMRTLADLDKTSEQLWNKIAAGQLTAAQGHALVELIDYRRRVIETVELEKGMSLLEAKS